jgi:hypothetical protein
MSTTEGQRFRLKRGPEPKISDADLARLIEHLRAPGTNRLTAAAMFKVSVGTIRNAIRRINNLAAPADQVRPVATGPEDSGRGGSEKSTAQEVA